MTRRSLLTRLAAAPLALWAGLKAHAAEYHGRRHTVRIAPRPSYVPEPKPCHFCGRDVMSRREQLQRIEASKSNPDIRGVHSALYVWDGRRVQPLPICLDCTDKHWNEH